jgi:hypothetical protein
VILLRDERMKKIIGVIAAAGFVLSGCVVVPVESGPQAREENFCPPGQAKKGNCRPDEERGFCPPGQAKKGNC